MERKYVFMATIVIFGTCIILGLFFLYIVPGLNIILNFDTAPFGTILTIVGAVGTVSGILLGIYNFRLTRKLAKEALKKADLGVIVLGQRLIPNTELNEIDFGCSVGKDDEVICIIPVSIVNTGDLSAKNVHVRLSLPLALTPWGLGIDLSAWETWGVYDMSDLKAKIWIDEGFEHLDFVLPELAVHKDYGPLEIPISVTYSPAKLLECSVKGKDSIDWIDESSEQSRPPAVPQVYVEVSATDVEPAHGHFSIRYFETRDMQELLNEIQKDIDNTLEKMLDNPQAPRDAVKRLLAISPELKRIAIPKYYRQVKGALYRGKYFEAEFVGLEVTMSKRKKIVRRSKLKTDPLLRDVVHLRNGNTTISKRRKLS